ncbi:hypothetical protein N7509_003868 [Penicillium cosmopolitanum]|uniref:Uncharacterized protein n=1 Tax=Penicillium cosmopolitanum TaxID=1131564 RepID=A0A9W9W5X3_9EURO|nr:uncharacterized protein N7509_003868 [Penicillium cosmopolitanum]KAJ5403997.1 hypothetical protein N7509_003868 [Penicillium cosmopolitanum]
MNLLFKGLSLKGLSPFKKRLKEAESFIEEPEPVPAETECFSEPAPEPATEEAESFIEEPEPVPAETECFSEPAPEPATEEAESFIREPGPIPEETCAEGNDEQRTIPQVAARFFVTGGYV